jgi:hypothetical protein
VYEGDLGEISVEIWKGVEEEKRWAVGRMGKGLTGIPMGL